MKFLLLPGAGPDDAWRPNRMNSPGQAEAHPMQSTHLSLSILLPEASAQFMGQDFSHIPQETHLPESIVIRIGATDDANPSTVPTGHQSQNLLPRKNAHPAITIKNAAEARACVVTAPFETSDIPKIPRPKFDMGSGIMNMARTAAIIPTAETRGTAYLIFLGEIYFFRDIFNAPDALQSNS
jgi:hypothetical protein